jgi:hypothetical protein
LDDDSAAEEALLLRFKQKRVDTTILTPDVVQRLLAICNTAKVEYMQKIQLKQSQSDLGRLENNNKTPVNNNSHKRPAYNQGSGILPLSHSYDSPTAAFGTPHPNHYCLVSNRQQRRRTQSQSSGTPAETQQSLIVYKQSYSTRRANDFHVKKSNHFKYHNPTVVDKFALIKHISKKPPTFSSTGISNRGVHNITNLATTSPYRELTQAEINTLSLGLKHIITPNSIKDTAILEDFNKYRRSIRLRFQFFNSPPDDTPLILRIPNPEYVPNRAPYLVERYLRTARKKILSKLRHNKVDNSINIELNKEHYNTIKHLKNDMSIIILKADKSAGIVIANRTWYILEVHKLLSNIQNYKRIHIPDLPSSETFYNPLIHILKQYGQLHDKNNKHTRIAEYMLQLQHLPLRFPVLYGLVKLHKPTICLRPILSCIDSPTYHASKFIDWKLKNIMTNGFSYIKDSKQLLLLLQNHIQQTCNSTLLSADVVSLYPSIDLQDAYPKIRTYLTTNSTFSNNETNFIMDLLIWIMENNYCKFSDTYFRQLKGVAMGQPCAVVFAVIYLLQLETELLNTIDTKHHPILFKRFIDDIFAIFTCHHMTL